MKPDVAELAQMSPGFNVSDPHLKYWLGQVNLRLRRELAWCWFQRTGEHDPATGALPPFTGVADDVLNWSRSDGYRCQFFAQDKTAAFLSECIAESPAAAHSVRRGDWCWLVDQLSLTQADQFVLALALAFRLDAGIGPVCAAALNDANKAFPTLALAQRLWDQPEALLGLAAPAHPLRCLGLLDQQSTEWQQPLALPAWLAEGLCQDYYLLPGMRLLAPQGAHLAAPWAVALHGLRAFEGQLCRVPLLGQKDEDFCSYGAAIAQTLSIKMVHIGPACWQLHSLTHLLSWCWLVGVEPVLPWGVTVPEEHWPLALPLRLWQPMSDRHLQKNDLGLMPPLTLPSTDYLRRLEVLEQALGEGAARCQRVLEECARRFRFSEPVLRRIALGLRHRGAWDSADLIEACRHETRGELAQLTQQVFPRFSADELVLAPEQEAQFSEVARAMDALTQVHYRWGTARVWNESGLSILFCGPPGTGKTMAAEALATRLQLDMYRVDLAQVVSKYVGETEKNLRRIFDAAEASDCLLFFDESDALFGKRTDVKDAHDRYANIEVSYLLERMERFKGLAILASNRRKDMDEAFLRRLRYVIEFPVPGIDERERIWRRGFPDHVDTSALDFRFLARQFAFAGGHIRSVIFNACLQAAACPELTPARGKVGKPSMRQVLLQVRRELQKLNRAADEELFGNYARLLEEKAA